MTTDTLNKVVADESKINDTRKAELLSSEVEHIDITSFDARPIVEAMGKMSFTSRDLARAANIYNEMLSDKDCSVILVIAGSTSAGGCMDLYTQLVKSGVFVEVNSWDEYISTFVNGSVGGLINGVWIVGSIQTAEDQAGNWSVTNLPKLDGVSGATNYSANGGSSWVVTSNANVDLASDFLAKTFAGSTELYDTILPKAGAVANWIPAGESDVYGQPIDFFGGQPIFSDVVAFGADVPSNNTGVYYYEGRDAVSAAITKILGGADLKSSLDEAQSAVEFAMG